MVMQQQQQQEAKLSSVDAAADLIRTLNSAFSEMSSYAASAAEDADDARRNARAASEVARRYRNRTYPVGDYTASYAAPSPLHSPMQMPSEATTNGGPPPVGGFWNQSPDPPTHPQSTQLSATAQSFHATLAAPAPKVFNQAAVAPKPQDQAHSHSTTIQPHSHDKDEPLDPTILHDQPADPAMPQELSHGSDFDQFEDSMEHHLDSATAGPSLAHQHQTVHLENDADTFTDLNIISGFEDHRETSYSQEIQQQHREQDSYDNGSVDMDKVTLDPSLKTDAYTQQKHTSNGTLGDQQQYFLKPVYNSKNSRDTTKQQNYIKKDIINDKVLPTPGPPLVTASPVPKPTAKSNALKRSTPQNHIAQSHAEDVLSLSLELERTKQALQTECLDHEKTRALLRDEKSRLIALTCELTTVKNARQTENDAHEREVSALKEQLERAAQRVQAADEDAQIALNLAKSNAESREQVVGWLQSALNEIELLRSQHGGGITGAVSSMAGNGLSANSLPSNSLDQSKDHLDGRHHQLPIIDEEEGAEGEDGVSSSNLQYAMTSMTTTTVTTTTTMPSKDIVPSQLPPKIPLSSSTDLVASGPVNRNSNAPKSMVLAGRDLLRRATFVVNGDDNNVHNVVGESHRSKSAEKRQRVRDKLRRLENNENDDDSLESSGSVGDNAHRVLIPVQPSSMEDRVACQTVMKLLKESGTNLKLSGRWFHSATSSNNNNAMSKGTMIRWMDAEELTKSYCKSVQIKIARQQEEVKELEALCEYLERKITASL